MPIGPELLALLESQDGLVAFSQAGELGVPLRSLNRRRQGEGWRQVAPRVYLAGGHRLTHRARVRAAGLSAGDDSAVSGPAAAWWHGMLRDPPARVTVTVPRHRGYRGYPGVRVRRRDLDPADVTEAHGLRVTGRALTALETALAVAEGSVFLDRALQRHVRFPEVYEAYCRNMGLRGGARVAALLTGAADRADSAAERIIVRVLRAAGISGWQLGLPFERWTLDLAFPTLLVAVEIDGWAWHVDVARFRSDRHKGNALVRAGWTVLRFTWHDLTNRPEYVVAQIRGALRSA